MAKLVDITTGGVAISATGPVAGSADTSTLADFTIRGTMFGLAAGKKAIVAFEDTSNSTPFTSDALQVCCFHIEGSGDPSGISFERRLYEIPSTLHGAANNKLRANITRLDSGATGTLHAWLDE